MIGKWPRSQRVRARAVEIHIDELVLQGFGSRDRYQVADAVEREMVRLLSEEGLPVSLAQSQTIVRLDAGSFRLEPSAPVAGRQLASAIYRGLGKPQNRSRGQEADPAPGGKVAGP